MKSTRYFFLSAVLLPVITCFQFNVAVSQTTLFFVVNQGPLPQSNYNWSIQADRLTVDFTDSSTGSISQRFWYFGDGDSTTGNLTSVSHTYASKGVYQACLRTFNVSGCYDEYCEEVSSFVGVEDGFLVKHHFNIVPNPFQDFTTVSYQLSNPASVLLEIYDAFGKKIKTLVQGDQSPGIKQISINRADDIGEAGLYFLRLTVDGETYTERIVHLK